MRRRAFGLWLVLLGACGGNAKQSAGDASECRPGSVGCACDADRTCGEGLVCEQGTCHGEGVVGLSVSDPNARGCEVLLSDDGAPVSRVDFSDDLAGTQVREAPRTALAFIARDDVPIANGAVQVRFAEASGAQPEVSLVHCTDRLGNALEGAKVLIHD